MLALPSLYPSLPREVVSSEWGHTSTTEETGFGDDCSRESGIATVTRSKGVFPGTGSGLASVTGPQLVSLNQVDLTSQLSPGSIPCTISLP